MPEQLTNTQYTAVDYNPLARLRGNGEHGDEGGAAVRVLVGSAIGVTVLGVGLVVGLKKDWINIPGLPEFGSAPDSSSAQARGLEVVADQFGCRSQSVMDLAGSEALSPLEIGALSNKQFALGARIEEGEYVSQMCARGDGLPIAKVEPDEEGNFIVDVDVDRLVVNDFFNQDGLKVVAFEPEASQIVGAIPDFLGGILKGGCNIFTRGEQKEECEKANVLSNAINDQQARLNRAIVVTYQAEVRKQCGPVEWDNVKASITDSFKEQVEKQNGDPNKVIVNYRDSAGNLTSKTPDYDKTILDELKESGVLTAENPDDPKVMLSTPVTCTPSAPYVSRFPDNSQNPDTPPYVDPKNL